MCDGGPAEAGPLSCAGCCARVRDPLLVRLRTPILAAAAAAAYAALLREPILTWGATREEAAAMLPGDELQPDSDGVATRAVWIEAPASAVWPWLAQMGPAPRGGAYTYDWIENALGLKMQSVERVLPEFQDPRVGEEIAFGANRMRLELLDAPHAIAWLSADGNWVWSFVLREQDGATRLISRNRYRLPTLIARAGMLALEPGSLVMERKMLLGIKRRAERLARERATDGAAAPQLDTEPEG
jgi:hypothetical protein